VTSLDELRRTLEQRADLAPDATGLVEQARAGAERIRRRNRIRAVTAVAAVVVLALAAPVVVRSYAADPPPNPAGPMTYYREPHQLTLELAPSKVYFTLTHGTQGRTQILVARPKGTPKDDSGGTIAVHDPGTFDPTRLRQGEPVTVQGHPAFYVTNLEAPASAVVSDAPGGPKMPYRIGSAVGWQDRSGAWVVVYEAANRAATLRLAENVRLTAPRTARAPVRFGWVPRDLPVTYFDSRDIAEYGVSANVAFGDPARGGEQSDLFFPGWDAPLTVQVLPMNGIMTAWGEDYAQRQVRTIAGHKTWYLEGEVGNFPDPDGSQMLIQAGSCGITVLVDDRQSIPYPALQRMVENMTFGGCDDISDWMPVVGS
jgi:hypothetical protein